MFQFGELFSLAVAVVTIVYVAAHRRRISAMPLTRALLPALFFMVGAWGATVVEGLGISGPGVPLLLLAQESPIVAQQSGFSEVMNLAEHVCYAASGIALLVAISRTSRRAEADW